MKKNLIVLVILCAIVGTYFLFTLRMENVRNNEYALATKLPNFTYISYSGSRVSLNNGVGTISQSLKADSVREAKVEFIQSAISYGDVNGDGLTDALVPISEDSTGKIYFVTYNLVLGSTGEPIIVGAYNFEELLSNNIKQKILKAEIVNDNVVVNYCEEFNSLSGCDVKSSYVTYMFKDGGLVRKD